MDVTGSPKLSVDQSSIDFGTNGISAPVNITNIESNCGTLNWNISDNRAWISVSPINGSTTTETDQVTISVSRHGLSEGTYSGTVTISSNGGTEYIQIEMIVEFVYIEINFGSGTGATFTSNYWSSIWIKRFETDYCNGDCPSWHGCPNTGTILLRGGGLTGEQSWIYPSEVGSGDLGLSIGSNCTGVRADLYNIDLENQDKTEIIVRTDASCELPFPGLTTTCTSKYNTGLSGGCFKAGRTEISVVQIDHRTLGDYSVALKGFKYTFTDWMTTGEKIYKGSIKFIQDTEE